MQLNSNIPFLKYILGLFEFLCDKTVEYRQEGWERNHEEDMQ